MVQGDDDPGSNHEQQRVVHGELNPWPIVGLLVDDRGLTARAIRHQIRQVVLPHILNRSASQALSIGAGEQNVEGGRGGGGGGEKSGEGENEEFNRGYFTENLHLIKLSKTLDYKPNINL